MSSLPNTDGPVTFCKPTIGPKIYIAKGPSGWPETFYKSKADSSLRLFLGKVTIKIAVDDFIRRLNEKRTIERWEEILEHLSRLTSIDEESITPEVGVAFWAHVSVERDRIDALRKAERTN